MPGRYEILPTLTLISDNLFIHPKELPELVHLEDPALDVMIDFKITIPAVINPNEAIDDALNEMKIHGVHVLIVTDNNENVLGLINTEDILGEKPLQIMQQRGLKRSEILVKMVMTPQHQVLVFDNHELGYAKVGSIVNTLKAHRQHYALVVNIDKERGYQIVCGMISSSDISRQLHMDITNSLREAPTLAELQKRKR